MAEEENKGSFLHVIGVAAVALIGGMARFADDCARVGAHVGSSADDLARVGATGAEELGHLGGAADDLAHASEAGVRAVGEAESLRLAGAADDGTSAGQLLEHGLDVADAVELGLDVADLVSPEEATEAPKRPHLVVAKRPNTPATAPVDPLVLLVADADAARIERLTTGCTTPEHRCVVLACPPDQPGCIDAWVTDFGRQLPDLSSHPEAVAATLAIGAEGAGHPHSRVVSGVMTPTGPTIEWLTAR